MHAIDRLATLLNNIKKWQLNNSNVKVFPKEVPLVAPMMAPIAVSSPRVTMIVSSPRVMAPRIPLISQEENLD